MRQIAQSLVLDDTIFAETAAQQVRTIDLILVLAGCGDDVSGSSTGALDARQNGPGFAHFF